MACSTPGRLQAACHSQMSTTHLFCIVYRTRSPAHSPHKLETATLGRTALAAVTPAAAAAAAAGTAAQALPLVPAAPPALTTCGREAVSASLQQAISSGGSSVDSAGLAPLIAYFKRLGCTDEQLNAALDTTYGAMLQQGDEAQAWLEQFAYRTPADNGPLLTGLTLELCAVVLALRCWQGWADEALLEARTSRVAGRGLFARRLIPKGTTLGCYPGRVRTPQEMDLKVSQAPSSAQYAFITTHGFFLDPTDATGQVSEWPAPGWPWPFPTQPLLAFANEPPAGSRGTNCFVEDGASMEELLFIANRDIGEGEELFIDYGTSYNRSSYEQRPDR